MVRTLSEGDKRWLEFYSRKRGQSTAGNGKRSTQYFRNVDAQREKLDTLDETAGIWAERSEAAAEYVNRVSDEW